MCVSHLPKVRQRVAMVLIATSLGSWDQTQISKGDFQAKHCTKIDIRKRRKKQWKYKYQKSLCVTPTVSSSSCEGTCRKDGLL